MPTTTAFGYTVPILGDPNNPPADFSAYAASIEPWLNNRFANATERTAALTAAGLGSGVRGMRSWLDSPGHSEEFNGTDWVVPALLEKMVAGTSVSEQNGGPAPASTSGLILMGGSRTVTISNTAGGATFTWPQAFPTGLITCVVVCGDSNDPVLFTAIAGQCTTTNWGGVVYTGTTPLANGALARANFIALGW